jgi:hypothetical protein
METVPVFLTIASMNLLYLESELAHEHNLILELVPMADGRVPGALESRRKGAETRDRKSARSDKQGIARRCDERPSPDIGCYGFARVSRAMQGSWTEIEFARRMDSTTRCRAPVKKGRAFMMAWHGNGIWHTVWTVVPLQLGELCVVHGRLRRGIHGHESCEQKFPS